MASALGLPKTTRETASVLYRRAVNEDLLYGWSVEGVSSACLDVAVKQGDLPYDIEEIVAVSREKKSRILRPRREIVDAFELNTDIVSSPDEFRRDITQHVRRIVSEVNGSERLKQVAIDLLDDIGVDRFCRGSKPRSCAGGLVYVAGELLGAPVTQSDIAAGSGPCTKTVREHSKVVREATSLID